jgi:DMSO/TMAO reductase YedYZ molybdopterin-dependent catalytic subunit
MILMRWGMPPPPRTGGPPVTNIRNTSSPHWRGWLKPEHRCLVPANSFAEYAPEPNPKRWTWKEFRALPTETVTVDIHCVTKWSKLDTAWTGVSMDVLLDGVETAAEYAMVFSDGGYTTNLPLEEMTGKKAWVVFEYDGQPLHAEHGGPVRLLVPHLYLWKSAKWVRGLTLQSEEHPGFWESNGYNMHGDPWLEQRYWGD